jgi:diacylglycerol kinase family enzyme
MIADRRVALVVNPAATRTTPQLQARFARELTPFGLTGVADPIGPDEIRAAVVRAVTDGAHSVAVLGGDGTIGIAASVLADTEVTLIPLPGGNTNVLARGLGWPSHPERAVDRIADALSRPPRDLVIGRITSGDRHAVFCVNAGIGLDAATVAWVERHPGLKRRLRQGAFAVASVGPGLRALRQGPPLVLHVGSGSDGIRVHSLIAACGAPYAYLGPQPLNLLPHVAWDGRLEWIGLTNRSLVRVLRLVVLGLTSADHLAGPGLVGGTTESPLRITAATPFPVQVDGDPFGEVTDITIAPGGRLRVYAPGS